MSGARWPAPTSGLAERHARERGVSTVELLVASLVMLVVLPTAGALLYIGAASQREVRSTTEAVTTAQAAVTSVERGVRNAVALRYSRPGAAGADELLVARVLVGPKDVPQWRCQAWFYSASRTTLYSRSVPLTPTTTALTAPATGAQLARWSTLATGVLRSGGGQVLRPRTDDPPAPSTAPLRVDVDLVVSAGPTNPPTVLSTTVLRRPQPPTQGAPCF